MTHSVYSWLHNIKYPGTEIVKYEYSFTVLTLKWQEVTSSMYPPSGRKKFTFSFHPIRKLLIHSMGVDQDASLNGSRLTKRHLTQWLQYILTEGGAGRATDHARKSFLPLIKKAKKPILFRESQGKAKPL